MRRWIRHPGWVGFLLVVFVMMPMQPNGRQAVASDQGLLTNQIDGPMSLHTGYLNGQPQLFVTTGDCVNGGFLYGVSHAGTPTQLVFFEPRTVSGTLPCTKLDVVVLPTPPKVQTSTVAVQLGREGFVLTPSSQATIGSGASPSYAVDPAPCTSPNLTVTVDPLGAFSAKFKGLIVSCGDGTNLVVTEVSDDVWNAGTPATYRSLAPLSGVSVRGRPGVLHPNWAGCGGCLGAYDDVQRALLVISPAGALVQQVPLTGCISSNSGPAWVFSTLRFSAFGDPARDPSDPGGQGVMASVPSRDQIVAFRVSTFSPHEGKAIVGTFSGPIVAVSHLGSHPCTQVHASLSGNRSLEDGTPGPHRVFDIVYSQEAANNTNQGPAGNVVATIYSSGAFHPAELYANNQFIIFGFGRFGTEDSFIRCKPSPDANGDQVDDLKCWFDAGDALCSTAVPCLMTAQIDDPEWGFGE